MNMSTNESPCGDTAWYVGPSQGQEGTWREITLHRPEEVVRVLEDVVAVLPEWGYSERDRAGVRLALEEAIVNGLRHGNRGDTSKSVWVRYRVGPNAVLIDVEDEGPGFDPKAVADPTLVENRERPGGRGLLLMRHFMTWVQFSRRGNRVTMCKRRST
jgi:serine/threonine-protein kinase RsbW